MRSLFVAALALAVLAVALLALVFPDPLVACVRFGDEVRTSHCGHGRDWDAQATVGVAVAAALAVVAAGALVVGLRAGR